MKQFLVGISLILFSCGADADPREHHVLDYQREGENSLADDWHAPRDQPPNPELESSRRLMDKNLWEPAIKKLLPLLTTPRVLTSHEWAEATYRYGFCLEKIGDTDEAITQYRVLITAYLAFEDWSSQAFERAFEHIYKSSDSDERLHVYTSLRRFLYQFQLMREEDYPSGALARLRNRLPEIEADMKLTDRQIAEVDEFLGIPPGSYRIRPKQNEAQSGRNGD